MLFMKKKLLGILCLGLCVMAVGCGSVEDSKAGEVTTTTTSVTTTTSGSEKISEPEEVKYIFTGDASQTHEGVELSSEQISVVDELFEYLENWAEDPCDIDSNEVLKGGSFEITKGGEVEKLVSIGSYSNGRFVVNFGGESYLTEDEKIGQIYEFFIEYQASYEDIVD